jgi:hypothetical protein
MAAWVFAPTRAAIAIAPRVVAVTQAAIAIIAWVGARLVARRLAAVGGVG